MKIIGNSIRKTKPGETPPGITIGNDELSQANLDHWKARALGAEADYKRALTAARNQEEITREMTRRIQELRQEVVSLKVDLLEAKQDQ